ncbi:MAG: 30S ribosome-binding factor RbfA [gamma proteobacterium endosymbiont of Trioza apicalis]
MKKNSNRFLRITKKIHQEISIIMHYKINDLRIKYTNISNVEISRDLIYAKIFVTFLNNKKKNLTILQNASGFIRNLLSKKIYLFNIPKLLFIYNKSFNNCIKIANLIKKCN